MYKFLLINIFRETNKWNINLYLFSNLMDRNYEYEGKQIDELIKARAALQLLKSKKGQNSSSSLPIYMQNSFISKPLGFDFNNNNNQVNSQGIINEMNGLKRQASFQNNLSNSSKNAFYSNRNNYSNSQLQNFRNHNRSEMSKFPPQYYQNTYSKNNSKGNLVSQGTIGLNERIEESKDIKDLKDFKDRKISNLAQIAQNSIKNISGYSTKTEMYDKRIEGFDRYPESNQNQKINYPNKNNLNFQQNIHKTIPKPTPPASYKIPNSKFNVISNNSENEDKESHDQISIYIQNNSNVLHKNNLISSKYKETNFEDRSDEDNKVNGQREIFSEKENNKNIDEFPIKSIKSPKPEVSDSSERIQCQYCERKFAQEALEKHEKVCIKVFQTKRKEFNTKEKRVTSNEQVKLQKIGESKEKPKKESSWKIKSQKFRQAISQLNQNSENNVPLENPDYIKCEFCGRSFNENAAQRHIEFCSNKAKLDKFKEGGQKKPSKSKKK